MAINTFNVPYSFNHISQVVPFSYNDASSMLEIMAAFRNYLNNELIPHVNSNVDEVNKILEDAFNDFQSQIDTGLAEWQALFDQFMLDVTAELAALNDQAVADNINDTETATRGALDELIERKAVTYYNVKDYGAVGDGVADDSVAIRATVAAAGVTGGTVYFPRGRYWLPRGSHEVFPAPGPGDFVRYMFYLTDDVSVYGPDATLVEDTDYTWRRICFFIGGSNITIDGLTFENIYDMAGGSRPTGIPIAGGDEYDASLSVDFSNIRIQNCDFIRPWHPVKFGYGNTGGALTEISTVSVTNCRSYGEPDSTSSGGYNFKSVPPGRVHGVRVVDSVCDTVTVSAAIGLYGVQGATVTGNTCKGSHLAGGGVQLENGSDNVAISSNTLTDHFNGVWVDDSSNVAISGNAITNTGVDSSFKGIRVTYQGYDSVPSQVTTGIVATGNSLVNCYVATESFSTPHPSGTPKLGNVTIADNMVTLDGVTNIIGIRIGSADSSVVTGNTVVGASSISIRVAPKVGQSVTIQDNHTKKLGSEDSVGFALTNLNASRPLVAGNRFDNGMESGTTSVSDRVGDTLVLTGQGDPTGAVSAPQGSVYLRTDAAGSADDFYTKHGSGLSGWISGASKYLPWDESIINGDDGKKYHIIAGVLRNENDGNGWQPIENSTHHSIGITNVTTEADRIVVDYPGHGHQKAISFVVGPDEQLAMEGVTVGASVGNDMCVIQLGGHIIRSGYVEGQSDGTYTVQSDGAASAVWDGTANSVEISYKPIPTSSSNRRMDVQVTSRGPAGAVIDNNTAVGADNGFNVAFYNSDGSRDTAPSIGHKFTWSHTSTGHLTPSMIHSGTYPNSNIWFMGIFEL